MTYHIGQLNLEKDLHDVHQLTIQLGYPSTLEKIKQRWEYLHQDSHYQTLVIKQDSHVIGYAGFIQEYTWEFDGGYLRIQAFVIDQAHRGKGIGKQLMAAIEQIAKEQGFKMIQLNSGNREERYPAHTFYQGLGFDSYSIGFRKHLE
ncbi:GNAT family N-acetyltransferase [Acinetobacter variabilis]|uniref:GNAT family N-acetyltransferase n=1 Tax=Acinetobacter variabilis TaxID=70346 RepID=UPI000F660EA0|nr:GNAT family N-acetyltransferase [Acinetobacter variabilis]QXR20201.1 GNAT family N-acetyltransferase [Acinetobacter variabilis]